MKNNHFNEYRKILIYIFLCFLFVISIQQFALYKGNIAHLVHAIKEFNNNKLQNDWIANQSNHLPLFTYFNFILIKLFSNKIIYIVHGILLGSCALFIFLICKEIIPKLQDIFYSLIWFALFIFIYHENSFFTGVAGQYVIDEGYQPASFGVLFFIGYYFFLKNKNFLCVFFICLSASFHPTYILHSGFFIMGILVYFLIKKKYSLILNISFYYIFLIAPITIFIILNFLNIDQGSKLLGQEILLNRIPHHANIHQWLSYKDGIFLGVYFLMLFLTRKNLKFFIPLMVFGFCSIFLSLIQFFINSPSLALAFPWRTSVFISPISSMICLSFLINKIAKDNKLFKSLSLFFFVTLFCLFFYKSHFIKNLNAKFQNDLLLVKKIKNKYDIIDVILIPVRLDFIRMNLGIPIFIDWKHHAFKYNEVISWKSRVDLASEFYNAKSLDEQKNALKKIQKIEKISHILIDKKQLRDRCKNLIDDEKYFLVASNDCLN